MLRFCTMTVAPAVAIVAVPAVAATAATAAPAAAKVGCASPEAAAAANPAAQPAGHVHGQGCAQDAVAVPKVVFKLNTADDAPTILRFVANYPAVEPDARVAVVG